MTNVTPEPGGTAGASSAPAVVEMHPSIISCGGRRYAEDVGLVSDGTKAVALVRKAVASRAAAGEVRHRLASQPPRTRRTTTASRCTSPTATSTCTRSASGTSRSLSSRSLWPVVVLSRAATGAKALLAEDRLPVAFVPTVRDLEQFVAEQDIRVVLYVNQNTRNFQMFRYGRRWHVFINHGESDKMYMTTNQYKAYDYAFIAGDAARERLSRVLWDYDLDRRAIAIGRPQADHYCGCAAVHARRPYRGPVRADLGGRSAVGPLRLDREPWRGARGRPAVDRFRIA